MIIRATLNKSKYRSIDEFLTPYELYTIESLVDKYTRYVATDDQFAIIRKNDVLACDIDEILDMAEFFNNDIKEEIIEIYEDILYLKDMNIDYNSVKL